MHCSLLSECCQKGTFLGRLRFTLLRISVSSRIRWNLRSFTRCCRLVSWDSLFSVEMPSMWYLHAAPVRKPMLTPHNRRIFSDDSSTGWHDRRQGYSRFVTHYNINHARRAETPLACTVLHQQPHKKRAVLHS